MGGMRGGSSGRSSETDDRDIATASGSGCGSSASRMWPPRSKRDERTTSDDVGVEVSENLEAEGHMRGSKRRTLENASVRGVPMVVMVVP